MLAVQDVVSCLNMIRRRMIQEPSRQEFWMSKYNEMMSYVMFEYDTKLQAEFKKLYYKGEKDV